MLLLLISYDLFERLIHIIITFYYSGFTPFAPLLKTMTQINRKNTIIFNIKQLIRRMIFLSKK